MRESKPFHIIGSGCGGTSLLAGLVDYHPQVEVGFELFAMRYLYRSAPHSLLEKPWWLRAYQYKTHFEKYLHRSNGTAVGNKITTEQLAGLLVRPHGDFSTSQKARLLMTSRYIFQNQPLILLLRDGRSCIPSKMNRGNHSLEESVLRWRASVDILLCLHHSWTSTLLLRYEDLIESPESTLRQICSFLALDYDPVMLKGTSNSKMHPRYQAKAVHKPYCPHILPDNQLSLISDHLMRAGYL